MDGTGSESEEQAEAAPSAAPAVPVFNIDIAVKAEPKKTAAKRSKKEVSEADEVMTVMNEVELMKEIGDDLELRQVHKALDRPYGCLAALIPERVLANGLRVGHQVRGAPWRVFFGLRSWMLVMVGYGTAMGYGYGTGYRGYV